MVLPTCLTISTTIQFLQSLLLCPSSSQPPIHPYKCFTFLDSCFHTPFPMLRLMCFPLRNQVSSWPQEWQLLFSHFTQMMGVECEVDNPSPLSQIIFLLPYPLRKIFTFSVLTMSKNSLWVYHSNSSYKTHFQLATYANTTWAWALLYFSGILQFFNSLLIMSLRTDKN